MKTVTIYYAINDHECINKCPKDADTMIGSAHCNHACKYNIEFDIDENMVKCRNRKVVKKYGGRK